MAAVNESASSTSGVAAIPRPVFTLVYGQRDITTDITPYVTSVTYSDNLSGQSDELEVALEDTDGRWVDAWYPGKGDVLTLHLGYAGAPLLACGAFEIDEIEFSRPPSTVTIRALATGIKKPVRTHNNRPFEGTTLKAIAQSIAKRNQLTLTGCIREIPIDRITQYQERDLEFLARLAREYGYVFKVRGDRLVFSEMADIRDRAATLTLNAAELSSIRLRDKVKAIYESARGKHHDPKTKKLIAYDLKDGQMVKAGPSAASGDTLKLNARAGSKATAQVKTQAALDAANAEQTTGSVSTMGDTRLVAGITVEITECGRFSGRYLVNSARHRLERGSGYSTEIEIKRAGAKKAGKAKAKGDLLVYGVKADGQVGVVGTTPKKPNNAKDSPQ